jgi:hypothetical protein
MTDAGTATKGAKQELRSIGDRITFPAGQVVIALQQVGPQAFRVSVNTGLIGGFLGVEVDGASYPDEATARAEARRMAKAFYDGTSPAQLAERREALADLIDVNEHRRTPEARSRAARYRRELDAIAPLAGRPQQLALSADVAATMTRAFADALAA